MSTNPTPSTLPALLAVMLANAPGGYPEVLEVHVLSDRLPLGHQVRPILAPWMETGDLIQIQHTPSGRIAVILTDEGDDVDVFAVEVPAEKGREALHRWARAQGLTVPSFADFTEADALDLLPLATARKA